MEGKIRSIDATARSITLDNGVQLWLADGVRADAIEEGANVRLSFEERNGKPIATRVEVK